MSTVVDNLEPKSLWKHFAALSAIPRASEKEEAARNYVLAQAAQLKLDATQDAAGNLVVRKPAKPGREGAISAARIDAPVAKPSSTTTTERPDSGTQIGRAHV